MQQCRSSSDLIKLFCFPLMFSGCFNHGCFWAALDLHPADWTMGLPFDTEC